MLGKPWRTRGLLRLLPTVRELPKLQELPGVHQQTKNFCFLCSWQLYSTHSMMAGA